MFRPVLVEDEQQFLRSTEGENGKKHPSTSLDDRLNKICAEIIRTEMSRLTRDDPVQESYALVN